MQLEDGQIKETLSMGNSRRNEQKSILISVAKGSDDYINKIVVRCIVRPVITH